MSFVRIKETFLQFSKHTKLIGIGGFILAISAFLPWYADLDAYKIGDQFLGITGPASFVGIIILALGGFSLWIFSRHLLSRRIPRLPVREGILHLFVSLESLLLLVLVNSIFFHPKFGVNITLKESRFGMTLAFIGAITLFIGAYLQNKEEMAKADDPGRLEPLIKINPEANRRIEPSFSTDASLASKSAPRMESSVYQRPHSPIKTPQPEKKAFLFGEIAPELKKAQEVKKDQKDDKGGSYMIRMDL